MERSADLSRRVVEARAQPLELLVLGDVEHQLDDTHAVVRQVALEVVDHPVAGPPHRLRNEGVYPHNQHVLVVGPVEDGDLSTKRTLRF